MAVRNGGSYLDAAVDSLLQQTYSDFHFLIVDDESTDNTRERVRSYTDDRIELLCLDTNLGQAGALNAGLRKASTPWIARMDADDYSAPTRLEEQMRVLDRDPSLSCVGTFAWIFRHDPQIEDGEIITPTEYSEMKRVLLGSPIIHGTIVVNREAILDVGGYNERYPIAADVEMYDRLLAKYRATTIPKKLLGVRRHPGQRSNTSAAFKESIEISKNRLLNNDYSAKDRSIIRGTLSRTYLFRSRNLVGEGKYLEAAKGILSALRASPKTFPLQWLVVFVVYNINEHTRAGLRRLISRLIPRFKAW